MNFGIYSDGTYSVVLDRFNPLFTYPYSITAMTFCGICLAECVVGAATYEALTQGKTDPICKECAMKLPADTQPIKNIEDPEMCPDCHVKHPPNMTKQQSHLN